MIIIQSMGRTEIKSPGKISMKLQTAALSIGGAFLTGVGIITFLIQTVTNPNPILGSAAWEHKQMANYYLVPMKSKIDEEH